MKKSFWFWLCFIVAVIFATYFSARIVMTVMGRGGAAVIKNISIHTDSPRADLSGVVAALQIAPGTKTYSVSLDELRTRAAKIPDIEKLSVRRLANGNINVNIKMHNAIATWADGNLFYPLTVDGSVINRPDEKRPDKLVVFRGTLPNDISGIVRTMRGTPIVARNTDYLEWIENRRWNLVTVMGTTVMLPEQGTADAISALSILTQKHQLLSRKLAVIDMRDNARILVK